MAEIFRAGIEAVPAGQWEAAQTLGMYGCRRSGSSSCRRRAIVFPPLVGQYLSLIKDTSIAFVIGLVELLRQGQAIIDRAGEPIPIYLAVAVLYFVICYPLSLVVRAWRERLVPA